MNGPCISILTITAGSSGDTDLSTCEIVLAICILVFFMYAKKQREDKGVYAPSVFGTLINSVMALIGIAALIGVFWIISNF
jgi:asparagine N-glycosylation enzyme membrane subunit Stt3